MRILLVAPFPPRRCGIGAYAAVEADRLRADGHAVTVLSPPDGDGDVRVPFEGGRPFRAAARLGRSADRIVVHFQPALYYRPRAPLSKVATSLSLWWLCARRRQTELLIHEADPPVRWRPDYLLLGAAFRVAPVLLFHTAAERDRLQRQYGIRVRSRVVDHREGIRVRVRPTRREARARLGLPADEPVFVTPGFLHPDKGAERAAAALGRAGRLYIVGSVKDRTPPNLAYLERLRDMAGRTERVELVEQYLEEEDLDMWVAAADAVVLPYRRSWSSGALARAQTLGVPAIVTAVGGLAEQAGPQDEVVADDEALAVAMAAVSSDEARAVGR